MILLSSSSHVIARTQQAESDTSYLNITYEFLLILVKNEQLLAFV